METFSAFQVSTGPTVMALVGTSGMLPPPDVRAFCAMVIGMQIDDAGVSLRYSAGDGGRVFVFAVAPRRIVEGPMLDVALAALHDGAAHAVPALAISGRVGLREMEVRFGITNSGLMRLKHSSRSARSKESGCVTGDLAAVVEPFVHAPEMR